MRPSQRLYPRRGRTGGHTPAVAPRDTCSPVSGPPHDTDDPGQPSAESAEALHQEIAQLQEALDRRPVIDLARGILMTVWSCTADEAWELLVDVSQHSNTKLYTVAEAVLPSIQGEPLPAYLQDHLAAAVVRLRAHPGRRT
ncbi:ANTAR domain-containing protein [Streptomyces tauricus]|uniref:ANTAR domain-containing protein n=1 Tax=Streptomyces tauricus TaxID=68274 RepID=UPI0022442FDF|nr:ANTAR domain-containing protein [Streptomyces tauricus]MCW8102714.1 ANTAR domain-containing protein [Streptomyces tauricus]